jgi:HEAT repeat protein
MRSRREWHSRGPGVLAAFLLASTVAADGPAPSRVDALRKFLRHHDPNTLMEQERVAVKAIDDMRATAELRKAFVLREWQGPGPDEKINQSKRLVHDRLAKKLENQLRGLLKNGGASSQLAAIYIIGELGEDVPDVEPPTGPFAVRLRADLIALVKSGNGEVRVAAVQALGKIGADPKETVPALEPVLQKGTPAERRAAAEALGNVLKSVVRPRENAPNNPDPSLPNPIPELASLVTTAAGRGLADADVDVRGHCHHVLERAAQVLGEQVGDPPFPETPDAELKIMGAQLQERWKTSLGFQRALSAQVPGLVRNLKDEHLPSSLSAFQALEAIGQTRARVHHVTARFGGAVKLEEGLTVPLRRAVPDLSAALSHKDVRVQLAALYVLETLESEAAAAAEAVTAALDKSEDPFVRWGAARALAGIAPHAPARAVPVLARRLDDENHDVRLGALLALQRYGPAAKPALEALTKAVRNKDRATRALAVEVLGTIGKEAQPAAPVLITALSDSEDSVRMAAVVALPQVGPLSPEAVAALRKAMSDSNSYVRLAACDALVDGK